MRHCFDPRSFCSAVFVLAISLSSGVFADGATTAYQRGMLLERSKNYQAALTEFQAVTEDDANYVKARKEIGTCHYYLHQNQEALEAYEEYLAVNPSDSAMQAFVAGLRKSVPTPVPTPVEAAPTPVPVKPFEISYGVRATLGYGFGMTDGGFGYGRFDTFDTNACTGCFYYYQGVGEDVQNDRPYHASPGSGAATGMEVLAFIKPQLELGLGVFPLGFVATGSSFLSSYGNFTQSDNSLTRFQSLPIIASLYGKIPLSPALNMVMGFGLGYVPAGNLTTHSDYSQNTGGGSTIYDRELTKSFGGALALRTVLGTEYTLNQQFSVQAGISLLWVDFSAAQDVVVESATQAGARYKGTTTIQYVDAPPSAGPVVSTSSGSTQTWDDGRTHRTQTTTYDSAAGQWVYEMETTTKAQRGLASNDLNVQQLAPFLAVTWHYF
jgi:hypothetical protein